MKYDLIAPLYSLDHGSRIKNSCHQKESVTLRPEYITQYGVMASTIIY